MLSSFNLNLPKPATIFQNSRHIYHQTTCDQANQRMVDSIWQLVVIDANSSKADIVIKMLDTIDTLAAIISDPTPRKSLANLATFGNIRNISAVLFFAPFYLLGKAVNIQQSIDHSAFNYVSTRVFSLFDETVEANGKKYGGGEYLLAVDASIPGLLVRSAASSIYCSLFSHSMTPSYLKSFKTAFNHEYKQFRLENISTAIDSLKVAPDQIKDLLFEHTSETNSVFDERLQKAVTYCRFDPKKVSLLTAFQLFETVATVATVCFMEYQRAKKHLANSEDTRKALSQYVFSLVFDMVTHYIAGSVSVSVSTYFSSKVSGLLLTKSEQENKTVYPYFSCFTRDVMYSLVQGIFSSFRKESYYLTEDFG